MKLYADDFFISNSLPNMQKPLNVYGEINMPKKTRRTVRFQQFSVKTSGDCFRIKPFAMTHYENFIRHCERSEAISRVFNFTENAAIYMIFKEFYENGFAPLESPTIYVG